MIQRRIGEDEEIWLYKKGSRGEVVGIYRSVKDIVETEKLFHKNFVPSNVYMALNGQTKTFMSYNHQCRVVPKIRKIENTEVNKKS